MPRAGGAPRSRKPTLSGAGDGGPPGAPRAASGRLARGIVESSPDAIIVTSLDRRIFDANEAAARLFDRTLPELIGTRIDDCVVPAERQLVERYEREAARGHPQRYETRILTARKSERIVAVASAALHQGGKLIGTAATLRDITDEFHAHATLARSEARYRHLFEGASDAIMTFDASGTFTTVNRAGEEISGYGRDELVGESFGPLIPEEEIERTLAAFRRALAGETGTFETIFVRKDGDHRFISVTYSGPKAGEEVLCIIRDITEQRQLQQQLIQSEKMAAIGQLVSGVAHELNNPLASVSAFAQLLLADARLPVEHRHSAEVIAGETRRAARIVNNLLTFARQHKAEKIPADINRVLENALELRAYELNVRGINLVRDYDDRVPETMADIHQLQQVFLNIVTNAEQAMESVERRRHQLLVRTRALPQAIRVEFEDTGPGIPSQSLERIFNPFYTTKPTGRGTGLGLSISLGIVHEHNGRVWAENIAAGGSRFCIDLPYIEPVRVAASAQPEAAPKLPPGLRILVADDEDALRLALTRFLGDAGHAVVATASGREALFHAEREKFDAMILDIRMPDMSGQQVFRELLAMRPELAECVVFMTGDTVSTDLRQFLLDSGRAFVAKPFEFKELLMALPRPANGTGS
ncbi:MAG TPA: PAS domain S-box protein [Gemmatimonadaceae bacterium]|nr:PAS domain S-box protein [Gemmatimonadaceae bacterium]